MLLDTTITLLYINYAIEYMANLVSLSLKTLNPLACTTYPTWASYFGLQNVPNHTREPFEVITNLDTLFALLIIVLLMGHEPRGFIYNRVLNSLSLNIVTQKIKYHWRMIAQQMLKAHLCKYNLQGINR